jgi:hypothetical protein
MKRLVITSAPQVSNGNFEALRRCGGCSIGNVKPGLLDVMLEAGVERSG